MSVALVFLLSACAVKPPVSIDYDTTYDFERLKNYAWILPEEGKVATLDNKRQTTSIETLLNNKGFNRVDNVADADFLLKTHTITDKKTDVERFYRTWGYYPFYYPHHVGWPHNTSTSIREYKIGTLVLDIVDPEKKQVIWRGSVSKPLGIYKNRTPEERMQIAMSNAKHMLDNFPPKTAN